MVFLFFRVTTLYKTKDLGRNVIYPTTIFERHQCDSICLRGFHLTNDSVDRGQGLSYHGCAKSVINNEEPWKTKCLWGKLKLIWEWDQFWNFLPQGNNLKIFKKFSRLGPWHAWSLVLFWDPKYLDFNLKQFELVCLTTPLNNRRTTTIPTCRSRFDN